MKLKLLISLGAFMCSECIAQTAVFEKEMKEALYIHDTAQSAVAEIKALAAFESLSKRYDKEWLPAYWASYLCTQLVRLDGAVPDFPKTATAKDFAVKAQEYFDVSKKRKNDFTAKEQSDLHVLQGFIYSLYQSPKWNPTGNMDTAYWSKMQNIEYKEAARLNNENFNLQVIFALRVGGGTDKDYINKIVAISTLTRCNDIIKGISNRSITTSWSSDFIGFWIGRIRKQLNDAVATSNN